MSGLQRGLLAGALLALLGTGTAGAAPPSVTPPVASDVTDRSFAVVWIADEAAGGTVRVFSDSAGTTEITGTLVVVSESPLFPPAEANGVLRVRVSGLAPATTVFLSTETTSQATSETTSFPAAPPLVAVTLALAPVRSDGGGAPLINDPLAIEVRAAGGVTSAPGTLVLGSVAGAAHPVSAFTGEGSPDTHVLLDLNNLYAAGDGMSLIQMGGEALSLVAIGGGAGAARADSVVPVPTGLGAIQLPPVPPLELASGGPDSDGDGFPDAVDVCPVTPDVLQADLGGPGGGANGIGDVCECGDVSDDGTPDALDLAQLRQALALLPPGLTAPEKCNVLGATDLADANADGLPDDCDVADAVVLARLVSALGPGISPVCAPAVP